MEVWYLLALAHAQVGEEATAAAALRRLRRVLSTGIVEGVLEVGLLEQLEAVLAEWGARTRTKTTTRTTPRERGRGMRTEASVVHGRGGGGATAPSPASATHKPQVPPPPPRSRCSRR